MRRSDNYKCDQDLWKSSSSSSSSSSSDDEKQTAKINQNNQTKQSSNITPTLCTKNQSHTTVSSIGSDDNSRLDFLPAYPSFDSITTGLLYDHLLLASIPRHQLTAEQRRIYFDRDQFQPSFEIIDQSNRNRFQSFFLLTHRELFANLIRRLHVPSAILDYNYQRLLKCFDLMTNERISYGFQKHTLTNGDVLPLHEYSIAMEFFLQFDPHTFFMKTCLFRGANMSLSSSFNGIFCLEQPHASYSMTACRRVSCRFCFPPNNIRQHTQSILPFSSTQEHVFVSGYRTILNCPATCETKGILYVLTCPCGQYDYIGYTSMTLAQRLAYHREHGNRIIHEFILGTKNVLRTQTRPKSTETLVKDDMLLYKHSARCPIAMKLFLNCNPYYCPLIPMLQEDAHDDNQFYDLPTSIPHDPISLTNTTYTTRSDHETGYCMNDLPPLPSNKYTYSLQQCAKQFEFFKNRHDCQLPNFNLDLYHVKIIAVLPDNCSTPLYRLLETLFITHTQTKLNTLGHLENISRSPTTNSNRIQTDLIVDRGDWCANLQRHSSHS